MCVKNPYGVCTDAGRFGSVVMETLAMQRRLRVADLRAPEAGRTRIDGVHSKIHSSRVWEMSRIVAGILISERRRRRILLQHRRDC